MRMSKENQVVLQIRLDKDRYNYHFKVWWNDSAIEELRRLHGDEIDFEKECRAMICSELVKELPAAVDDIMDQIKKHKNEA